MKKDRSEVIETHEHIKDFNRFEKVLMAASRAKEFYDSEAPTRANLIHKPTYQALMEVNEGKLKIKRSTIIEREPRDSETDIL